MLWIIWGTIFTAFFLLTYALASFMGTRLKVKGRVDNPGSVVVSPLLRPDEKSGPKEFVIDWLAFPGKWAMSDLKKVSKMRKFLIQAGIRHPKAPAVYFGLRLSFAFLVPLPFLFFLVLKGKVTAVNLFLAFFMALIGFVLPAKALDIKIRRRQDRLDKALSDILDLFVICMEAGLSLNAAINRVADEIRGIYKDFYEELQITAAELRTGIPWDEAFDNLGHRTEVQSIRSMVGLMIQTDRLGASIGTALRNHSEFIRTQRILRAEERAAKLPVKMLFPLIFCIFPAIIVVVVGPGLIHIADKLFGFFLKGKMAQGIR